MPLFRTEVARPLSASGWERGTSPPNYPCLLCATRRDCGSPLSAPAPSLLRIRMQRALTIAKLRCDIDWQRWTGIDNHRNSATRRVFVLTIRQCATRSILRSHPEINMMGPVQTPLCTGIATVIFHNVVFMGHWDIDHTSDGKGLRIIITGCKGNWIVKCATPLSSLVVQGRIPSVSGIGDVC